MGETPQQTRVVHCVGRRRIVVKANGPNTVLEIWLGDPPHGRVIAGPELEPLERDRLLLELTEQAGIS